MLRPFKNGTEFMEAFYDLPKKYRKNGTCLLSNITGKKENVYGFDFTATGGYTIAVGSRSNWITYTVLAKEYCFPDGSECMLDKE